MPIRLIVVGEVGGWYGALEVALRGHGLGTDAASWPRDVVVLQLGSVCGPGPDNLKLKRLCVDSLLPSDHWHSVADEPYGTAIVSGCGREWWLSRFGLQPNGAAGTRPRDTEWLWKAASVARNVVHAGISPFNFNRALWTIDRPSSARINWRQRNVVRLDGRKRVICVAGTVSDARPRWPTATAVLRARRLVLLDPSPRSFHP